MSINSIGISVPRQDALAKVTGKALYTGDFKLPGCLESKVLRSPYPHARILNIDTSRAKQLRGVKAVITAADLPGRLFGNGIKDQPVLAGDRVRFVGERAAAVAAEDSDTAQEALNLIRVDYEEIPGVTDPFKAMMTDAPVLHPEQNDYRKNGKVLDSPNIVDQVSYGIGDVEAGFARAELVMEHTFRTQIVHQGYLEPHICLAEIGMDDIVRIWSNNKAPFELREKLSGLLNLPMAGIIVNYLNIGGDFGGKGAVMDEPLCYYLALAARRPVRMEMTIKDELMASNPRHASEITIKSGLLNDGTLIARHTKVVYDAGAYAGANSHPIVGGIGRALGAYRIPNTRIDGYAVYTNSIPAGHCRAPGDPQVFFAIESHTDMIAEAAGLDPLEFRRRNALREGDISPRGLHWEGINALKVLETAAKNSSYGKERPANVGFGIALAERGTGLGASADVLKLHADGSATLVSGSTDPGTGSSTVMRQIVAQELQIPMEKINFAWGSTSFSPYDKGSGSSRVTHVNGQAVRSAVQDVVNQLKNLASSYWNVTEDQISFLNGNLMAPGQKALSLKEFLAKIGKVKNVIVGRGSYVAEKSNSTCFFAQAAEVEVDRETGHVTVKRIIAVNDIGKALNPLAVAGQIEGSVVQGIGLALNEEVYHRDGYPLIQSLADYKMATALDAPKVECYLVEEELGPGPYGAKSVGEQGIAATAPAIANAVYDAIGVRIVDLPITPEKILRALAEEKARGGRKK